MKTYEVTLKGFDASTDETDHLVKWVKASNRSVLDQWLSHYGLDELVSEVNEMDKYTWNYGFDDGVDVIVYDVEVFQSSADIATWHGEAVFDVPESEDEPMPVLTEPEVDHSPKKTFPSWIVPVVCMSILIGFLFFFMWLAK